MGWERCIREGHVRKMPVDVQRARSLSGLSELKARFVEKTEVNEGNAPILFGEMYDSLLELCQSVACLEGFKVLNHECLRYLLERLGLNSAAERFDRFRKIRNRINYYGKRVHVDFTESSIKEIGELVLELREFKEKRYR